MRVLLDACVLYPTVLRELLLGCAAEGLFQPLWSARILEEWARAAARLGPEAEARARAEIAALRARCPGAEVAPAPDLEGRLWLPDPGDRHVLGAALAGGAEAVLTWDAADFPRRLLAAEGLVRLDPDLFLLGLAERAPEAVARVVAAAAAEASRLSGESWDARRLLRKARLPRLARRLAALSG